MRTDREVALGQRNKRGDKPEARDVWVDGGHNGGRRRGLKPEVSQRRHPGKDGGMEG